MNFGIITLATVGLLTSSLFAPVCEAGYRGYYLTNEMLKTRLMKEGTGFALGIYLNPKLATDGDTGLSELLGIYSGGRLVNGEPNGVNMLLWYVAMSGLARDMARICELDAVAPPMIVGFAKAEMNESFSQALGALCVAWPHGRARTEPALLNFWLALVSFDAPMEEFEVWRDFLMSPTFAAAPAGILVEAAATSALMNPGFLLE